MEDVSAYLRNRFKEMHKINNPKNIKDRMDDYRGVRRQTRDTLLLQKRNINENNLSPYVTPRPSRINEDIVAKSVEQKPQDRPMNNMYEKLMRWKAEKAKKKQEEQKKAKPLFKVFHVPVEIGLPKLENVNKQIKGKLFTSKFAPPNHKFCAPKNITAIDIKHKRQIPPLEKNTSKRNQTTKTVQTGRNVAKATFTNKADDNKTDTAKYKITKVTSDKASTNRKNPVRITRSNAKIETPWKCKEKKGPVINEVTHCNSDHQLSIKTSRKVKISTNLQKTPSSVKVAMKVPIKTPHIAKQKGSVKYKERESIYSDDEISIKTPLKSPKTPKGVENKTKSCLKFSDNEDSPLNKLLSNTTEGKCERESIYSDDEISIKSPLKLPKTPTKPAQEIDSLAKVNIEKDIIVLLSPSPRKRKQANKIVKHNTIVKEGVIETSDEECLNNINDITSPSPRKKSRTRSKVEFKTPESTRNSKRDTIYSDDEISIRTPLKTPKSTSKIPRTPRSAKKVISTSSINSELTDCVFSDVTNEKKRKSFKRSMNESMQTLITPDRKTESLKAGSKVSTDSSVYISPFVTISRGKESARKEYKIRQSTGGTFIGTPECKADFAKSTTPEAAADYFTVKLDTEIARLEGICDKWEAYKDQNELSEDTISTINVAIGQSRLLIAKKFQQFRSLIEQCRSCQYKEKSITCQDLHGFWDMIYMQVEDLDKRFINLDQLKENGWDIMMQEKKVPVKRPRSRRRKMAVSSKLKDVIKAARSRKEMEMSSAAGSDIVIHVQEPTTGTPSRDRVTPLKPSSIRRSLRVSLLSGQKRRAGSSPGLTVMRISQAIKNGDGLTPSKSILKTDLTRSEKRVTKSVLFKDELEEHRGKTQKLSIKSVNKENLDSSNMMSFSPI